MATVSIATAAGELSCTVQYDLDYPGLTVYWGDRQIAVIEPTPNACTTVRVLVWGSEDESPTAEIVILPESSLADSTGNS